MAKIAASGHCYGMAVLQVLVHNGIIKPSDIQEGAETIHDIQFNDDVNGVKCPSKLDKQWYINLAKKRLGDFGVIT